MTSKRPGSASGPRPHTDVLPTVSQDAELAPRTTATKDVINGQPSRPASAAAGRRISSVPLTFEEQPKTAGRPPSAGQRRRSSMSFPDCDAQAVDTMERQETSEKRRACRVELNAAMEILIVARDALVSGITQSDLVELKAAKKPSDLVRYAWTLLFLLLDQKPGSFHWLDLQPRILQGSFLSEVAAAAGEDMPVGKINKARALVAEAGYKLTVEAAQRSGRVSILVVSWALAYLRTGELLLTLRRLDQEEKRAHDEAIKTARAALLDIKKEDLQQLRAFTAPSMPVQLAVQALCLILSDIKKPTVCAWADCRKLLGTRNFVDSLMSFDLEGQLSAAKIKVLRSFITEHRAKGLTVPDAEKASPAAGHVAAWIFAQLNYAEALRAVQAQRQHSTGSTSSPQTPTVAITPMPLKSRKLVTPAAVMPSSGMVPGRIQSNSVSPSKPCYLVKSATESVPTNSAQRGKLRPTLSTSTLPRPRKEKHMTAEENVPGEDADPAANAGLVVAHVGRSSPSEKEPQTGLARDRCPEPTDQSVPSQLAVEPELPNERK